MKQHADYYTTKLYPFQDGVLNIVKKSKLPFYLTGGTALSRGWFNHRYSDDLDFFVNNDPDYQLHVEKLFNLLDSVATTGFFRIDKKSVRRSHSFTQLMLYSVQEEIPLKIDIVNDIASHFGRIIVHQHLGRIDAWRNILSNKLSALYRYEPKDIVDIRSIARTKRFSWKTIFNEAKEKDAGLDILAAVEIITTFPLEMIETVKWVDPPDQQVFIDDLKLIGSRILAGTVNLPWDRANRQ